MDYAINKSFQGRTCINLKTVIMEIKKAKPNFGIVISFDSEEDFPLDSVYSEEDF